MEIMIARLHMFSIKFIYLFFLFHVCNSQRRIQNGEPLNVDKRYVVYFLKAVISTQYYEGWTCGGALVTTDFIVTSAACVTDVPHLFAIAGYRNYIPDLDIDTDPCTKVIKKKVILICTPKAYELRYEELTKWSFIDIAVVRVESPYNLNDMSFTTYCSYTPTTIPINNEEKYQLPGIDSLVFGWGHRQKWRELEDTKDYNEQTLNYSPVLLEDKEECIKHYTDYPGMDQVINKYMICTHENGNINAEGEVIVKSPPTAQGCTIIEKLRGGKGNLCTKDAASGEEIVLIDNHRRTEEFEMNENATNSNLNFSASSNLTQYNDVYPKGATRRNGICQNDHGGPLVTWVGSHEVLIGVSSVFKISESYDCMGPYLFTSTQCNGAFLDCIVRFDENVNNDRRRQICGSPAKIKGFDIITKHISWLHHPAGPADNERNFSSYSNENSSESYEYEEFSDVSYEIDIDSSNSTTSREIKSKSTEVKSSISNENNKTVTTNKTKSTTTHPSETSGPNIVNLTTGASSIVKNMAKDFSNISMQLKKSSNISTDTKVKNNISATELHNNAKEYLFDSTTLDAINISSILSTGPIAIKNIADKNIIHNMSSTINVKNSSTGSNKITNSNTYIINNAIYQANVTVTDPREFTNKSTYKTSNFFTKTSNSRTLNVLQNVTYNIIQNIFIFPSNYMTPIMARDISNTKQINMTNPNTFDREQIKTTTLKSGSKSNVKLEVKEDEDLKTPTANLTKTFPLDTGLTTKQINATKTNLENTTDRIINITSADIKRPTRTLNVSPTMSNL